MPDNIKIKDVKKGQLVWECHQGNVALIACQDAYPFEDRENHYPPGTRFTAYNLHNETYVNMYEADESKGYGLRLYSYPQYTGLSFKDAIMLMGRLAKFYQDGGPE